MALFFSSTKTKRKLVHKPINTVASKLRVKILAVFVFALVLGPTASARTFNPHNIITDFELTNKNSLSKAAIQVFLQRENSVLARYSQIVDGQTKTAAEMIWEIGQKHNISPKFLLTTLEKEQGLVSSSQATEKALDWATGYSCYGGTCNDKYKGFYNQTEAAAETQEIYIAKAGQFGFKVGQTTTTFDGYKVTPQNTATTNLYIYTPYVGNAPELGIYSRFGANKLFWRIWQRYFSSQPFLDGQVLVFNGNYYLIENNTKRKFISKEIFLKDFSENDAINVSSTTLAAYPDGPLVNFANNTVVKSAASGQIFFLTKNTKRPILNDNALALLSNFHTAISASEIPGTPDGLLENYTLGSVIEANSLYPQGKLFQDPSGTIWLIQDGLKHLVDRVVWQQEYNSATPETISSVDTYPTGEPIKLSDGTFVTNSGKYYLISQKERMKIEDIGIFDRIFGANKKNSAVAISDSLLAVHTAGEIIDYIDDTIIDLPTVATPAVATGSLAGSFDSIDSESLIMVNGQSQSVTISFKNTGGTAWQKGSVYLKATDRGLETSSFDQNSKIEMNEASVANGQIASFTVKLTAPIDKTGLLDQQFTLYHNNTQITSVSRFIIVKSGLAAQIVSHNIPIAVKNTWKPIEVTMIINNASVDTAWLSRRTALKLYDIDGKASPFYDSNDWVKSDVVGVPLNASTITPGANGQFKFTLDPRGVKPGIYLLTFEFHLLDKNKQPYLNGGLQWKREIRVD